MKILILLVNLCFLPGLIGCASVLTAQTDEAFSKNLSHSMQQKHQTESGKTDYPSGVALPTYLGSKSMPLKSTAILPVIFYQPRRYQYPGQKFSIERAAGIVSAETGVLIRVAQDVRGESSLASTVQGKNASVLRPPLPWALDAGSGSLNNLSNSIDGIVLNTEKNLVEVLNSICTQMGLNWEYRNGVVVIQRLVTRTFQLKVHPGTRQFDTSNDKSGNTQATTGPGGASSGGITTGIKSTATVMTSSGKVAAIDAVAESVRSVLTPRGKAIPNPATGTIMIIDTIDGIERAEKIINRENELLNRFTQIRIAICTFEQNDSDERGVDWTVAFQNLNKLGAAIKSPATITNGLGGSISLSVLATDSPGKFDGTTAFIKLLNENGKANTVYDQVVQVRNRVATAASATVQKVYLAETTPAPASPTGASGGAVGLVPGTITTGLDLQLQPNIYDSGQMSLLFSLGLLDLIEIQTLSSGTGQSQSSIQGPETKGYNFQQDVPLRVGETTFITGYEATLNSYTRRALGRDVSLLAGGSYKGNANNQKLFIFITPVSIGTTY